MIYLASPYTHPDPLIVEKRYEQTLHATAILMRADIMVYSPIVHCHEVAKQHQLPTDYKFWLVYNHHFILLSEAVYILCIDGWRESLGVRNEIAFASANRIKIVCVDEFAVITPNELF
jgi:hypothetical protein